ncbi:MAG: thermonuclease family protein [Thermodesulfobacteriota bacterium]
MVKRDVRVDKVRKNFYITLVVLTAVLVVTYVYTKPLKVAKVIEGTTLVLSNGKKVHLIGVDTSVQAEDFIRNRAVGKEVKLEYDRQKIDGGGRMLAYVYLLDGTFINAELIKQGYARSNKKLLFKYSKVFEQHEMEARRKRKGIWSEWVDEKTGNLKPGEGNLAAERTDRNSE